ncbi:PucR family transcriptional regulator [Yinghuangia sp. YIM S09857]|uniref:PucR family transcriptional regulator n=1 Tax=Yinghuangia sp. YIM S09857 TaxID=3436929 RepID=UPI003F52D41B
MFTLRSLAADEALQLRVLVPGPPGALDVDVAWVHNTELPDPSTYVGPGELVMTNGLWLEHVDAAAFVANVRRSDAAGIVFGLRESVRATPAQVVAACREAELPLLELAVEVPFTALSHAAASAFARRRQGSLEATVRRGNLLADAISRGAGTAGVLQVLRKEVDLPMAVVDRSGRRLAEAGAHLPDDEAAGVTAALTRHPPPLEVRTGDRAVTLFLVGAFGVPDAALVCRRAPSALTEFEQAVMQQGAHFLSLEIARRRAEEAVESRFAGELVDMIQSGIGGSRELTQRLAAFGVAPGTRVAVCAFSAQSGTAVAGPEGGVASAGSPGGGGESLDSMAAVARNVFTGAGMRAVIAPGSQDVVALFSWGGDEDALTAWCTDFAVLLSRAAGGTRVVVGYSRTTATGAQLRAPLVEAREACRILLRQASGPAVSTIAELSSYAALLGQLPPPMLRRMADALLRPLREQDASRNTQLEATLRTFLESGAQFAATADALFIHVNTLRKRLARIRDLTGRDPLLIEGRVDLFLALHADTMADS